MRVFSLLLIIGIIIIACDDENLAKSTKFSNSQSAWTELKNENGSSYTYTSGFSSFSGFRSTTEIKVVDGQVAQRSYTAFNDMNEEIESYVETGEEIGKDERGAAAVTIDELYTSCASEYLSVNSDKNEIFFETGDAELMTLCGFVPKNCADDCFQGVRINTFTWN